MKIPLRFARRRWPVRRGAVGPDINREFKFRMEPLPHLWHPACGSFVSEVENGDDLVVIAMMAHDHRCSGGQ